MVAVSVGLGVGLEIMWPRLGFEHFCVLGLGLEKKSLGLGLGLVN